MPQQQFRQFRNKMLELFLQMLLSGSCEDTNPVCANNKKRYEKGLVNEEYAASIQVSVEMNQLALADADCGISALVPKENLHDVFGAGLYPSVTLVIHNLLAGKAIHDNQPVSMADGRPMQMFGLACSHCGAGLEDQRNTIIKLYF